MEELHRPLKDMEDVAALALFVRERFGENQFGDLAWRFLMTLGKMLLIFNVAQTGDQMVIQRTLIDIRDCIQRFAVNLDKRIPKNKYQI